MLNPYEIMFAILSDLIQWCISCHQSILCWLIWQGSCKHHVSEVSGNMFNRSFKVNFSWGEVHLLTIQKSNAMFNVNQLDRLMQELKAWVKVRTVIEREHLHEKMGGEWTGQICWVVEGKQEAGAAFSIQVNEWDSGVVRWFLDCGGFGCLCRYCEDYLYVRNRTILRAQISCAKDWGNAVKHRCLHISLYLAVFWSSNTTQETIPGDSVHKVRDTLDRVIVGRTCTYIHNLQILY